MKILSQGQFDEAHAKILMRLSQRLADDRIYQRHHCLANSVAGRDLSVHQSPRGWENLIALWAGKGGHVQLNYKSAVYY